jgi:triacylglycerol lipase
VSNSLALAAVLAAAAALAGLGAWLWRRRAGLRRRWRRARARVRAPLPVVLVHGLFGFDEVAVGKTRHAYFKGIGPVLAQGGRRVVHARLPAAGSIADRAAVLARCIRAVEGKRVIALAHSMGGLDARWAIARLGLARNVAALVTVGTPHLGTPVADLTSDLAARLGIERALAFAGVGLEALHGLTSERMARFNEEAPDDRSVAYASVVGTVRRRLHANPLLLPGHLWLAQRGGDNDGVVPAASQRWGEVLDEIDADHWAQIGWSSHFDAGAFYVELVRELEASGV